MPFLILFIIIILVACEEQLPQETTNGLIQNKSTQTALEGVWKSPCERGAQEYVQSHVTFGAGSYHQEIQFHPDSNCQIKNKVSSSLTGYYEVGNEVVTGNGVRAQELNIMLNFNGDEIQYLDIFIIDNGVLYFGPPLDSDARPTTLDWTYPYNKQF